MLPQVSPSLLLGLISTPLVCGFIAYRLLPMDRTPRWTVTIAAAFGGVAIFGPLPFIGSFAFLWASITVTAFAASLVTLRILLDARRKAAAAVPPETKP